MRLIRLTIIHQGFDLTRIVSICLQVKPVWVMNMLFGSPQDQTSYLHITSFVKQVVRSRCASVPLYQLGKEHGLSPVC